jgi:hypothetical protein
MIWKPEASEEEPSLKAKKRERFFASSWKNGRGPKANKALGSDRRSAEVFDLYSVSLGWGGGGGRKNRTEFGCGLKGLGKDHGVFDVLC